MTYAHQCLLKLISMLTVSRCKPFVNLAPQRLLVQVAAQRLAFRHVYEGRNRGEGAQIQHCAAGA